jgi:hypothetical protein
LGSEELRYFLEVLASDPALASMAQGKGQPGRDKLALPARRARALRLLQGDQWQAAADLWAGDESAEAKARRDAAKLAADTTAAGHLRFAKWLRGPQGALLFPDSERAYSRGLKHRLDVLNGVMQDVEQPEPAEPMPERCGMREREQLSYVLLRGGRRERALEQYALALAQPVLSSQQAKATVKEADALYNTLINWDSSWSKSFEPLLAASAPAVQLREAGKRVRAKQPAPKNAATTDKTAARKP